MLQTLSSQQPALYEDRGQGFDLAHIIAILRRRIYFFVIPFLLTVMLGFGVVAIQRPIYRAEGKILVEAPEIPPDLVHPTITEVADQRVQVIQQRIMARDNLMAVVNKYDLFSRQRSWMSGTELLDLIRSRMEIKPVALGIQTAATGNPTIAFNLSFDYEDPYLAARVAGEFLTSILSEDASTRTNNAVETTKFLERDVKRLQDEHDAVVAQITAARLRPGEGDSRAKETDARMKDLADAESSLASASAVYSDEHPVVKNLRKKIAALKRDIAANPQTAAAAQPASPAAADQTPSPNVDPLVLERHEAELSRNLDDATRKLNTARLGESMEQGQQGERLQVIEQPSVPSKPVKPQRLKWYAVAFFLAGMIGTASVAGAEMLDGSIRGSRELHRIIDRHLIVTIPYLSTPGEQYRARRNLILLCVTIVAVLAAAIAIAVIRGVSVDFSWFDESWVDSVTRLLH
jgi:capsular polysaccharide biosynthesis protein